MEKYPLSLPNPKATSRTPAKEPFKKHPSTPIQGLQPLRKPVTVDLNEIKILLNRGAPSGD